MSLLTEPGNKAKFKKKSKLPILGTDIDKKLLHNPTKNDSFLNLLNIFCPYLCN